MTTKPKTADELLRALRLEVQDWQDVLEGERPTLDALCAEVDAYLRDPTVA